MSFARNSSSEENVGSASTNSTAAAADTALKSTDQPITGHTNHTSNVFWQTVGSS